MKRLLLLFLFLFPLVFPAELENFGDDVLVSLLCRAAVVRTYVQAQHTYVRVSHVGPVTYVHTYVSVHVCCGLVGSFEFEGMKTHLFAFSP